MIRFLLLYSLLCLFVCARGFAQVAMPEKKPLSSTPKWSVGIDLLPYFYKPQDVVRYQLVVRRSVSDKVKLRANVGYSGYDANSNYVDNISPYPSSWPRKQVSNSFLVGFGTERYVHYKKIDFFYGAESFINVYTFNLKDTLYDINKQNPLIFDVYSYRTSTTEKVRMGIAGILGIRISIFEYWSLTLETKLRAIYEREQQVSQELDLYKSPVPTITASKSYNRYLDFCPSIQLNFNF